MQPEVRIAMFPRLDSKLCIATVLSYLITWEQAVPFFACLNKRGPAYFAQHKPQFRYFIEDKPRTHLHMAFGDKTSQYVRPLPFSRVNLLYLSNVQQDLYQIQHFAAETLSIGQLWIDSRDFKLFSEQVNFSDLIGTTLPPTLDCKPSDRANLATIVNLLKKSHRLKLENLPQTGILLRMISQSPHVF